MYYLFKILMSALAVVAIRELAKRSSLFHNRGIHEVQS